MSIPILQSELASGRLTITALDDGSGVLLAARQEQLFSMNATGLVIIKALAEGRGERGYTPWRAEVDPSTSS
jgi:hypothetical protein